ncbi:HEXXH motif domain-containing protein [Micromonospora sp. NPDC051196]|uniref:HEXXH motif domain-containing protein n=1 Tax=Micromonospora sp. NPDC051196 TaxID=3155281 RepID=UPI0034276FD2
MSGYHRLRPTDLDRLAVGGTDAGIVRTLRAAQVSKRMLQLRAVLDLADSTEARRHFALLAAAARRDPAVGPAMLMLPHTGAWLAVTLRRLRRQAGRSERTPLPAGRTSAAGLPEIADRGEPDLGYLGMLAAAAAIRAGLEFEVTVASQDGTTLLPSFGRAQTGVAGPLTVSRTGVRVRVGPVEVPPIVDHACGPGAEGDGWCGLHRLSSTTDGLTLRITLDDLDPYRECYGLPAADRLDRASVQKWQRLLDAAWPILVTHHRGHAEAIAAGLRTLVPLQAESASAGVNVTSMDAFGAVSTTAPTDGPALALALLHEFQHAKLGAAIDVEPFYDPDDHRYYYVPWRDDPRPLGAALQGAYAFVAVTSFWRTRRNTVTAGRARLAEVEFARWRDRVGRTCEEIWQARLTSAGRRFVAGLRAVIDGWREDPVHPQAAALASEAADDHWTVWRLRNRRPDPQQVARLVDAWRAGAACPALTVPVRVSPADGGWLSRSCRLDLVRLRLADPERFDRLRRGAERLADVLPDASDGDLALAAGDNLTARDWYEQQLRQTPDHLGAWVGLTLADQRLPAEESAVRAAPELCRAVLTGLAGLNLRVDPVELCRWLGPVSCVPDVASIRPGAAPGHS